MFDYQTVSDRSLNEGPTVATRKFVEFRDAIHSIIKLISNESTSSMIVYDTCIIDLAY